LEFAAPGDLSHAQVFGFGMPDEQRLVEVTRTDPLEKLVWANRKDSDDERNKILN